MSTSKYNTCSDCARTYVKKRELHHLQRPMKIIYTEIIIMKIDLLECIKICTFFFPKIIHLLNYNEISSGQRLTKILIKTWRNDVNVINECRETQSYNVINVCQSKKYGRLSGLFRTPRDRGNDRVNNPTADGKYNICRR